MLYMCLPYVQDGCTGLFYASLYGHVEIVQLLLQRHADVSICEKVWFYVLVLMIMYSAHCVAFH